VSRNDDLRLARAHEQLAEAVDALTASEGWRRMLTVAARFHRYSPHNVLLITAQRPDATRVAGYRTWQQLGRQVCKGQKGIAILAPVTGLRRADEAERTPDDPAATARTVRGFRVTYVFDISQTEGPPLPDIRPQMLTGDGDPALYQALATQVTAAGYRLVREPCSHPEANGETVFPTRVVRVRPDLPDAQAVKTLAHELAHVRLHAPDAPGDPVPRDVAEVEAESVAYLVTAAHGLDTGAYTVPYVAGWAGGAKGAVLTAAERVLSTASSILEAAEPDEPAATATTTARGATRDRGAVVDLTRPVSADPLMTVQR
jgi:hypothetical protein